MPSESATGEVVSVSRLVPMTRKTRRREKKAACRKPSRVIRMTQNSSQTVLPAVKNRFSRKVRMMIRRSGFNPRRSMRKGTLARRVTSQTKPKIRA